ncbi:MAG: MFS transporter [Bryobacterales bacterium]|nr:MFS transporter [Bryobacterales bacterium]
MKPTKPGVFRPSGKKASRKFLGPIPTFTARAVVSQTAPAEIHPDSEPAPTELPEHTSAQPDAPTAPDAVAPVVSENSPVTPPLAAGPATGAPSIPKARVGQPLAGAEPASHGAPARSLLTTVFLLGTLLTLLGSVLPVWGYHRLDEFISAGNHFLLLALGATISNVVASRNAARYPQLVFSPLPGAALALLAIVLFALVPPPYPIWLQLGGAFCAGLATGALHATVFQRLGAVALLRSSSAFHLASVFWLMGATLTPLAVAAFVSPSNSLALLILAPVPLMVGLSLRFRSVPVREMDSGRTFREAIEDFRNPPAILLALLLFFQLGNEMALFGWLPVFLIQRLGVSPSTGLYGLALFSFALLLGRVAVQAFAQHAWRNRLVLIGLGVALLGCLMLAVTNNLFGALFGISLAGAGFAPIYPAALELIGSRFPYFHPGIFNSIFSIGLVGGMLAPWSLGLLMHVYGIQFVMVVPILGLLMVAKILGLLWLEAKLTGVRR